MANKKNKNKPRKDGALFAGQSKGYPKTLDIRYEKDLKLQKSLKNKGIGYNSRKAKMAD